MSLDARAIAHLVSAKCPRLSEAGARGHSDRAVAEARGYDVPVKPHFALLAGVEFERLLNADGKRMLRDICGLDDSAGIVSFADTSPDANPEIPRRTLEALTDPGTELIQEGALRGVGPDPGWVRPDILIRAGDQWMVGEAKSYLDRGGLTSAEQIEKAVLQAAVSVVALRAACPTVPVSTTILLLLQHENGKSATRHDLDASNEIVSVSDILRALPAPNGHVDDAIAAAHHVYSTACESRCALAGLCRGQAAQENPNQFWFTPTALDATTIAQERAGRLARGERPRASEEHIARALFAGWHAAVPAVRPAGTIGTTHVPAEQTELTA